MDAMEACDDGGVAQAHGEREGTYGMSGVYIVDKRGGRKKKKEMRK